MPVNSTHPDYDANAFDWLRARDVLAGEDAVKSAGEKYLPRLDSQSDEEFLAYRKRASFFNATARSAEGFIGLVFRRPPFVKVPESQSGVGRALATFLNDADMLGTTLSGYAKNVVTEVVGIGRAGSLIDWEGDVEKRAYVSLYSAEQILNWRIERVNGRNVPTLIVLSEDFAQDSKDEFEINFQQQIRVLKLVPGGRDDFHVVRIRLASKCQTPWKSFLTHALNQAPYGLTRHPFPYKFLIPSARGVLSPRKIPA